MPTSDAVRPPTPITARGIRPAAIALGLALSLALGACSSSDDDALVKAKQGTGRVSASDTLPADSTVAPATEAPTTAAPTAPPTAAPTTAAPTTAAPATAAPTAPPTAAPTTAAPAPVPATAAPTAAPTTVAKTAKTAKPPATKKALAVATCPYLTAAEVTAATGIAVQSVVLPNGCDYVGADGATVLVLRGGKGAVLARKARAAVASPPAGVTYVAYGSNNRVAYLAGPPAGRAIMIVGLVVVDISPGPGAAPLSVEQLAQLVVAAARPLGASGDILATAATTAPPGAVPAPSVVRRRRTTVAG